MRFQLIPSIDRVASSQLIRILIARHLSSLSFKYPSLIEVQDYEVYSSFILHSQCGLAINWNYELEIDEN